MKKIWLRISSIRRLKLCTLMIAQVDGKYSEKNSLITYPLLQWNQFYSLSSRRWVKWFIMHFFLHCKSYFTLLSSRLFTSSKKLSTFVKLADCIKISSSNIQSNDWRGLRASYQPTCLWRMEKSHASSSESSQKIFVTKLWTSPRLREVLEPQYSSLRNLQSFPSWIESSER